MPTARHATDFSGGAPALVPVQLVPVLLVPDQLVTEQLVPVLERP